MLNIGLNNIWLNSAVDVYSVAGFRPELVLDMVEEKYRANGSSSTFSNVVTTTATSNRVMTDSDGVLKWAPHNLATYSKPVNTSIWKFANPGMQAPAVDDAATHTGEIEAAMFAEDTSTGGHRLWYYGTGGLSGITHTSGIYVKANGRSKFSITFSNHSSRQSTIDLIAETSSNGLVSLTSVGSGWYLVSTSGALSTTVQSVYIEYDNGSGLTYTGDGTSGLYVWGMHLYRSDLGGMVNNPDRGDSYVPTTSAAVYMPRRHHYIYNGTSWVKAGLLVEPTAATNLIVDSNNFSAASWANGAISLSKNVTGPEGTSNSAWTVTCTASTAEHKIADTSLISDETVNHSSSIFAKSGTQRYIHGSMQWGANWVYAVFDLDTGTITETGSNGTGVLLDANMEPFGNGWYRISVSGKIGTIGSDATLWSFTNTATPGTPSVSFAATGSETLLIYGAQLELGSVPSSYTPTSGSTATRAAETVTLAAAKVPYSATALWIQMEGYMTYADNNSVQELAPYRWYLDGSNFITDRLRTDNAFTGNFEFIQLAAGTADSVTQSSGYSVGVNVPFNIASRRGSTFVNGAVDGTAQTANTTPVALPALSSTDLALAHAGGPMIISKFRMGTGDPGDAGIAEASA